VGDTISVGDVVCIVEAMKLFNEIESEISGKIVKVMVEDATPVEYDQVLYLIDPKG
jgi:acetyl-CoA carboxylase biotin carboxyl carrier protein